MLFQPGAVVANRFEIQHLAGKGGMGAVYRAIDRQTGVPVALKVVHEEGSTDHQERLVREARLLSELQHPSIVRYLAFGATDRGWPYLAMEWLEGEDLAMHLRGEGLDAADAVLLATRVAEALGTAHERGIVHRDIKPSNLFLVGGDPTRVKVLDFGVARMQLVDDGVTRTGAAVGTPRYMSPEQARGSRDVDVRADVFALGCVLFECLAGRPAFTGANQGAVLAKILLEDAPKLSSVRDDLPPALEQLLVRMLAKQREERPRDGRAVAAELAAIGALDATTRRVGGARDIGVTTGEQRLVCVVFAETALEVAAGYDSKTPSTPSTSYNWPTPPMPDPDQETATIDPRRPVRPTQQLVRKLETLVAEHNGRAEVLKDGSVVVTLAGQSAATDQAASGARCALALRTIFPNTAMALAIGRSADRAPLGDLIDRATAVLARPPPESVRQGTFPIYVDDVSAALLDLRFTIDGDAHGLFLSRARDVAVAARTLLGKPTECVGRDRELALLLATFEESVAEPMAHVTLVTAAAGIGKSRVRFELMQRLAQTGQRFELLLGRGDPMSAGTPFAMLAQALRRTAGVVDDEPASVRYRKLRARVMRNVPRADAEHVTEFLAELLGAGPPGEGSMQLRAAREDPQLMGDQMLRACQQFLAAECDAHPVVLVLEDLQWSDRATVQFVDAIVRQLAERPLFVLALARPEVDAVFPRLWADRRVERLQLRELTKRASEKLVRETLGDVAPELVARIIERAAGNAFYLEELIRSVAEGHEDRLPETVVAMVQARIEALEAEARHVLRAASIFGQVFWRGGVSALLDGGTTQVDDWLDELARRELITVRSESRFSGEVEYTFRHAIVREAAYAMVTDRDRMAGHRLAGTWLEARVTAEGADVEAVALAEHFLRGGEPGRSIAWYRHAAQQALEGDDLAGAIECAERAIACVEAADQSDSAVDRELVGGLRQLQAGAHVWRAEYALAAERGNEALALLSPATQPWLVAAAAVADACSRRLEHVRVLDLCRTLAATQVTPRLYHAYAHAVATTMTTLLWHGDAELIEQLFSQLARIEAAGADPAARAWIYYAQAWRALHDGDNAGALFMDQKVEHCFTEVGDLRQACRQHASVGYGELMLGANADAERSLRESIAIATRIGLHQVTVQAQHNLGLSLARIGRIDEARETERAALAAFDAQDNRRLCAFARNYLSEIELTAGNADAALTYAREALAVDSEQPGFHSLYRARIASAHLLAGDANAALDEATKAIQLMETHGRPEEGEMVVRLAYARALHATGHAEDALDVIADIERRLTTAAARIGDATLRRSFLEGVPEHALALSLARAWRS